MAALITRLDVERVNWIGISLGGLIGMWLAEQPNSPIGRLVLVDIGGYIGKPALERIAGVVSRSPSFPNLPRSRPACGKSARRTVRSPTSSGGRIGDERPQLSFAPCLIHARMISVCSFSSGLWPCGMRSCGLARPSTSTRRLLLNGSPETITGPYFVPFIRPS